jgi:uncharacterized membrane protein
MSDRFDLLLGSLLGLGWLACGVFLLWERLEPVQLSLPLGIVALCYAVAFPYIAWRYRR